MTRFVTLLLGCLLCSAPQAQDGAQQPLQPEEVLASSAAHFPGILQGLAQRRVAEGRVTEARGAFDLVFSADSFGRVDGFYDGTVVEGVARKPLRPLGASIYSKYSVSDGKFPVYEDQYFTNNGGDLKVGVLFSLLRDRNIDARRFAETDSELALRQADLELLLTRVGVQQRALAAYWQWIATGQQLGLSGPAGDRREAGTGAEDRGAHRAPGRDFPHREPAEHNPEADPGDPGRTRLPRCGKSPRPLLRGDDQGQPRTPDASRLPAGGVSEPDMDAVEVRGAAM